MATIATMPTVIVVSPEKGYKTLADLVAAGKAKPGSLVASTAGIGSATHMHLERFRFAAGIEVLNVHMKGAPEALTEVLTGRADFYFAPVFAVRGHVRDGKLLALANASPKRSALMPDLPTTVELGYPRSDYNFWVGALVSSKTPRPIVERLNREFDAAVQSPEVRERLVKLGADPLSAVAAGVRGDDPAGAGRERAAHQGGGDQGELTRGVVPARRGLTSRAASSRSARLPRGRRTSPRPRSRGSPPTRRTCRTRSRRQR